MNSIDIRMCRGIKYIRVWIYRQTLLAGYIHVGLCMGFVQQQEKPRISPDFKTSTREINQLYPVLYDFCPTFLFFLSNRKTQQRCRLCQRASRISREIWARIDTAPMACLIFVPLIGIAY